MLGDWSSSLPVWRSGDCTDHRALYARGLVVQPASLEIWGLHRPTSTICSGTGRPVYQFGDLGTAPTTEHCMLGDWSSSLPVWRSRDYTDQRALYAQGLVVQPASLEIWDCTDHRALYARGLVDQSASLEELGTVPTTKALSAWGLVDKSIRWQTSMRCSGTG